jgi:heme oxygenase (mycobilin-producing)
MNFFGLFLIPQSCFLKLKPFSKKMTILLQSNDRKMTNHFVAINYINCKSDYRERFEHLFSPRANAIDRIPGFVRMEVLKPQDESENYLVVSHWETEDAFKGWMKSPEFLEGHIRGFADVDEAKNKGLDAPKISTFKTYRVLST